MNPEWPMAHGACGGKVSSVHTSEFIPPLKFIS
jgi:hypothetical protein